MIIYVYAKYLIISANCNDLTATSLEQWSERVKGYTVYCNYPKIANISDLWVVIYPGISYMGDSGGGHRPMSPRCHDVRVQVACQQLAGNRLGASQQCHCCGRPAVAKAVAFKRAVPRGYLKDSRHSLRMSLVWFCPDMPRCIVNWLQIAQHKMAQNHLTTFDPKSVDAFSFQLGYPLII